MGTEAHALLEAISVIEIPLFYKVLDPMSISMLVWRRLRRCSLHLETAWPRSTFDSDSSFVSTGPRDGSADTGLNSGTS